MSESDDVLAESSLILSFGFIDWGIDKGVEVGDDLKKSVSCR